jgi:hypothetical protein
MGYSQVLWLDGKERKYVEEIGTSNAFFVIGDEVITAPLEGDHTSRNHKGFRHPPSDGLGRQGFGAQNHGEDIFKAMKRAS